MARKTKNKKPFWYNAKKKLLGSKKRKVRKNKKGKAKASTVIIGLIVVLGLAVIGGLSFSSVILDDHIKYVQTGETYDYTIKTSSCSAKTNNYPSGLKTSLWTFSAAGLTTPVKVKGSESTFYLYGSYGKSCGNSLKDSGITATSNFDFSNKRVKLNLDFSKGAVCSGCSDRNSGSSVTVYFGNQKILSFGKGGRDKYSNKGQLEIVPSVTEDDKYTIKWQGLQTGTYTIKGLKSLAITSKGRGTLKVSDVKYKPIFNCEVENDEIVIRESFTEGTTFDITSLNYTPIKFCTDSYPAVIRDLSKQKVASDIHGEITRKIARGEKVTVGKNKVVQFHYIADYKTGMGERCKIDEAFNGKSCVKIIEQAKDIVIIVSETVNVPLSGQERFYSGEKGKSVSLNIGNKKLSVGTPGFYCTKKETVYNSPSPASSCWKGTISFDGKSYTAKYGDVVKLGSYINLTYLPQARYDGSDGVKAVDDKKTVVKFKLGINVDKGLTLIPYKNDYYAKLNEKKKAKFSVKNNIASFASNESGVNVKQTTDLLFTDKVGSQSFAFASGLNSYKLPVNTSQYGVVFYQINPYIIVGKEKFVGGNTLVYNFEVVKSQPKNVTICQGLNCSKKIQSKVSTSGNNYSLWIIGAIAIIALVSLIGYWVRKK